MKFMRGLFERWLERERVRRASGYRVRVRAWIDSGAGPLQLREPLLALSLERCLTYTLLAHFRGARLMRVHSEMELDELDIVQLVQANRGTLLPLLFNLLREREVYERRAMLPAFVDSVKRQLCPSGELPLRHELFEQALGIEFLPAARLAAHRAEMSRAAAL